MSSSSALVRLRPFSRDGFESDGLGSAVVSLGCAMDTESAAGSAAATEGTVESVATATERTVGSAATATEGTVGCAATEGAVGSAATADTVRSAATEGTVGSDATRRSVSEPPWSPTCVLGPCSPRSSAISRRKKSVVSVNPRRCVGAVGAGVGRRTEV